MVTSLNYYILEAAMQICKRNKANRTFLYLKCHMWVAHKKEGYWAHFVAKKLNKVTQNRQLR